MNEGLTGLVQHGATVSSSSKHHREKLPEILADVNCLRDDFNKLYEKDFPQLQRCIEKLHNIIRKFEKDFRRATKGARDGGAVMGIAGSVGLVAGLVGLALAPFTGGASIAIAGSVAGVGAATAAGGGIYGGINSKEKERQMTQIRQDIEAELKKFQNIINPMSEKIKDINERIEKLLKELDKLERDASDVSEYLASTSQGYNMRREYMTALTAQMSITMRLIGTIAAIFSAVGLLLDLLSVIENTRVLNDIDKLAGKPINEQIDESEIKTKAGEFIVGMRKAVRQLQDIMEEIKKTKDKMAHIQNTI